jgi:hypothetical protein
LAGWFTAGTSTKAQQGSSLNHPAACTTHAAAAAYCVQVKLIMRFLADTSLSGGSWLWACPTPSTQLTHTPRHHSSSSDISSASHSGLAVAPSQGLSSSQPGGGPGGGSSAVQFEFVPHGSSSRRSRCDVEVVCSWRCIHSLTPDATQLAQQDWTPQASALCLSYLALLITSLFPRLLS